MGFCIDCVVAHLPYGAQSSRTHWWDRSRIGGEFYARYATIHDEWQMAGHELSKLTVASSLWVVSKWRAPATTGYSIWVVRQMVGRVKWAVYGRQCKMEACGMQLVHSPNMSTPRWWINMRLERLDIEES